MVSSGKVSTAAHPAVHQVLLYTGGGRFHLGTFMLGNELKYTTILSSRKQTCHLLVLLFRSPFWTDLKECKNWDLHTNHRFLLSLGKGAPRYFSDIVCSLLSSAVNNVRPPVCNPSDKQVGAVSAQKRLQSLCGIFAALCRLFPRRISSIALGYRQSNETFFWE